MNKLGNSLTTALLMLVMALAGSGCSDSKAEYSTFHPNLTFDNETHLDATLATAMDPMSTGIWCMISTTTANGAYYFVFSNNQGLSSRVIFNAIDTRQQSQNHIGMNNGLIVGFSIFGDGFFAYDAQCPDCFDYNALPVRNYQLTMAANGTATCAHCKKEFDMNKWPNGLTRYRGSTTGPFGLLRVF